MPPLSRADALRRVIAMARIQETVLDDDLVNLIADILAKWSNNNIEPQVRDLWAFVAIAAADGERGVHGMAVRLMLAKLMESV